MYTYLLLNPTQETIGEGIRGHIEIKTTLELVMTSDPEYVLYHNHCMLLGNDLDHQELLAKLQAVFI